MINAAMSADGKIDTVERRGASISSDVDKRRVLELRAAVDAVMVGGNTLRNENPKLTVKLPELMQQRRAAGLPENPAKVGIASRIELNPQGGFLTAGPSRKILFTTQATPQDTLREMQALGVEVFVHPAERVDLPRMLEELSGLGMQKILLEGGSTIISEFVRLGLADELQVYIAPKLFGGENAPTLVGGPGWPASAVKLLRLEEVRALDETGGVLIRYHFSM